MKLEDFKEDAVFSFQNQCNLWGTEDAKIFIALSDNNNSEKGLKEYLSIIEEKIVWVEKNREVIENVLLDKGILSVAEDWVASGEKVEDEEECYIVRNGEKVFLPITKEKFFESIQIESITIYCDEGKENVWLDIFLVCVPDYFAYHAINISIDSNLNIEYDGLAG